MSVKWYGCMESKTKPNREIDTEHKEEVGHEKVLQTEKKCLVNIISICKFITNKDMQSMVSYKHPIRAV